MKLFIQPIGGERGLRNFETSVKKLFQLSDISDGMALIDDHMRSELEARFGHRAFGVWGTKAGRGSSWEYMREGDRVLFYYDGMYIAYATIAFTTISKEMATSIWGTEDTGETWECLYFVVETKLISVPREQVNRLVGYSENFRPRGLISVNRDISEDLINALSSAGSSVEQLPRPVQTRFGKSEETERGEKELLTKAMVEEIAGLAQFIYDNGMENQSLSHGPDREKNSKTYNELIVPKFEAFEAKFRATPHSLLSKWIGSYLDSRALTGEYEARPLNFYGHKLNSYIWAAITKKDPTKTHKVFSYYPQLYVLVNRHGIRFGLGYGIHISPDDPKIAIVRNEASVQGRIMKVLETRKNIRMYSRVDPYLVASGTENISAIQSGELVAVWTKETALLDSISKSEIPADIDSRMSDTFDQLLEVFKILSNADPSAAGRQSPGGFTSEIAAEYSVRDFVAESGFSEGTILTWQRQLQRKGQVIFQGPPGTGKTFVAERLAMLMISKTKGFSETLQFHPSFAYEDFVQGIRPRVVDHNISFELENGKFLEFCRRAAEIGGNAPCVLIIDEINRANIARVFGELMYLLEYRDEEVRLASGGVRFRVPKNVFIIGTMNTADRSIALVDFALRRRFAFIRLKPEYEILNKYLDSFGLPADSLIKTLKNINANIDDSDHEIGISYFMGVKGALKEYLPDIWRMEIEPYLEELFYDQRGRVDQFRWDKLAEGDLRDWM